MNDRRWDETGSHTPNAISADFMGLAALGRFKLPVQLDTRMLQKDLERLSRLAETFSHSMSAAFARAVTSGRRFSDVLRGLALQLSRMALQRGLDVLFSGLRTAVGGLVSGLLPAAGAMVGMQSRIAAFAKGGIVDSPQLFALSGGHFGMMGEAGPEAILPLFRGPDGRLGVRAQGGHTAQVHVTMNITTPDVNGFRRNRGRIAAELARAVAEGQRQL